ncbi:hypothetical protein KEM48_002959 [Puccinia striiformis f. sp. tritici PST-130]|nr:hypothetical protein KEM48_002959 [Puccinia striiformis f. sp. tritici PST-130]
MEVNPTLMTTEADVIQTLSVGQSLVRSAMGSIWDMCKFAAWRPCVALIYRTSTPRSIDTFLARVFHPVHHEQSIPDASVTNQPTIDITRPRITGRRARKVKSWPLLQQKITWRWYFGGGTELGAKPARPPAPITHPYVLFSCYHIRCTDLYTLSRLGFEDRMYYFNCYEHGRRAELEYISKVPSDCGVVRTCAEDTLHFILGVIRSRYLIATI